MSLGNFLNFLTFIFSSIKWECSLHMTVVRKTRLISSQSLGNIMTNSTCLVVVSYYYSFSCEGITPTLGRKPLVLNKSMKTIERRTRKKGQGICGFSKVHTCTTDGDYLTSSCTLSNCCWMQGRQFIYIHQV